MRLAVASMSFCAGDLAVEKPCGLDSAASGPDPSPAVPRQRRGSGARATGACCAAVAGAACVSSATFRPTGAFVVPRAGPSALVRGSAVASVALRPLQVDTACLAGLAFASGAAAAICRGSRRPAQVLAAAQGVIDVDGQTIGDGVDYMPVVPEGGIPEEEKNEVPRFIYEGSKEVVMDGTEHRPKGQSKDPDNMYFWKMSKDKRTIDVIFPIDDAVKQDDIVYRLGEDPADSKRGPTLEMGYRKRTETGRFREHLVIDGQILNAINRLDTYWTIEDMAGVKVVVLTLTRPSMLRQRHDPILKRSTEEERIEPQTWDALLVEERVTPEVTDRVFFDISLKGEPAGRLELGLFGNVLPKTAKNFVGLVAGKYTDDYGNVVESAHCFKGTSFHQVLPDFLIAGGNPGLDHVLIAFTPEELKEYLQFYEDFKLQPKKVGKVEKHWSIRWGADLGLPVGEDGKKKKEGSAVDGNSESELNTVLEAMRELDKKGEGASFIFFRPEWEKGCDVTGGTFPAEDFKVPHSKRGMLSMDRNEDKDQQGSNFFITMKEFPEMDQRWVAFGEVLDGWDIIQKIEDDFEGRAGEVKIEDCGVLA